MLQHVVPSSPRRTARIEHQRKSQRALGIRPKIASPITAPPAVEVRTFAKPQAAPAPLPKSKRPAPAFTVTEYIQRMLAKTNAGAHMIELRKEVMGAVWRSRLSYEEIHERGGPTPQAGSEEAPTA